MGHLDERYRLQDEEDLVNHVVQEARKVFQYNLRVDIISEIMKKMVLNCEFQLPEHCYWVVDEGKCFISWNICQSEFVWINLLADGRLVTLSRVDEYVKSIFVGRHNQLKQIICLRHISSTAEIGQILSTIKNSKYEIQPNFSDMETICDAMVKKSKGFNIPPEKILCWKRELAQVSQNYPYQDSD